MDRSLSSFDGYFTTVAYRRLVIQVMTIRPETLADPYSEFDCKQTLWANALHRIWPMAEGPVLWPPLMTLDDEMLPSFHRRCDKRSWPTG